MREALYKKEYYLKNKGVVIMEAWSLRGSRLLEFNFLGSVWDMSALGVDEKDQAKAMDELFQALQQMIKGFGGYLPNEGGVWIETLYMNDEPYVGLIWAHKTPVTILEKIGSVIQAFNGRVCPDVEITKCILSDMCDQWAKEFLDSRDAILKN